MRRVSTELDHPTHVCSALMRGQCDSHLDVGDGRLIDGSVVEGDRVTQSADPDILDRHATRIVLALDISQRTHSQLGCGPR